MNTTTTWINPQEILESEVFSHRSIDNFKSHSHKWPTFATNVCTITAWPNVIIISHVNVKHQLPLNRLKLIRRQWIVRFGRMRENRANIYFMRLPLLDSSLEFFCILETLIANVNIISYSERPFSTREERSICPYSEDILNENICDVDEYRREMSDLPAALLLGSFPYEYQLNSASYGKSRSAEKQKKQ